MATKTFPKVLKSDVGVTTSLELIYAAFEALQPMIEASKSGKEVLIHDPRTGEVTPLSTPAMEHAKRLAEIGQADIKAKLRLTIGTTAEQQAKKLNIAS